MSLHVSWSDAFFVTYLAGSTCSMFVTFVVAFSLTHDMQLDDFVKLDHTSPDRSILR